MAGIFDVKENVALKDKNTFHVAATTRWYGEFSSADDLKAFYDDPRFRALPKFILGGGSNLLITQDFDGLMLKSVDTSVSVADENDAYTFVKIGAGADWTATVASLVDKGFNGIENLMSVPGTVGGAAVQNIGAYGLEIAERISEVECFDPAAGDVRVLSADDCDYGYRTSIFKTEKTDWVVRGRLLVCPLAALAALDVRSHCCGTVAAPDSCKGYAPPCSPPRYAVGVCYRRQRLLLCPSAAAAAPAHNQSLYAAGARLCAAPYNAGLCATAAARRLGYGRPR